MGSGASVGVSRREQLGRLALAVNYALQGHAQCITGVAILVQVADHFGFTLTPRAVAVVGQASNGNVLTTGAAATEHIRANGGSYSAPISMTATTWGSDSPFRQSGHMIAFDAQGNNLLDPSFEQFVRFGFPDTVISHGVDPAAAEWPVDLGDGAFVVYLPGADAGGWQDAYDGALRASAVMAAVIAAHLKAGGAPNTHGVTLDTTGAIIT